MNLFELERLRQEGKNVTRSGGADAWEIEQRKIWKGADESIDYWIMRKRKAKIKSGEQIEMEDRHNLDNPRLLGC